MHLKLQSTRMTALKLSNNSEVEYGAALAFAYRRRFARASTR